MGNGEEKKFMRKSGFIVLFCVQSCFLHHVAPLAERYLIYPGHLPQKGQKMTAEQKRKVRRIMDHSILQAQIRWIIKWKK